MQIVLAVFIHLASLNRSPEFCRILIEAYPGSERVPVINGALPLHQACANGSLATVEYLYRLYPDALFHPYKNGVIYQIHRAITSIVDNMRQNPAAAIEIVKFLLNCDPNQKLLESQGWSLLGVACMQSYNDSQIELGIQMVKIFFDAHPEAIEGNIISTDIQRFHQRIQAFINDHRLITTPDDNGQLPLHTALQNNVRLGSIKLLIKGNPSAIRNSDNNFAMPLHIACQYHDSVSVVQYLVDLDTRTLRAEDINDNTALHCACRGAKQIQ